MSMKFKTFARYDMILERLDILKDCIKREGKMEANCGKVDAWISYLDTTMSIMDNMKNDIRYRKSD